MKWSIVYNNLESFICLFISCIINISILLVGAGTFYPSNTAVRIIGPGTEHTNIDGIGFSDVGDMLGDVLGNSAKYLFGLALLASGMSSTVTGTYAGQFVMEGFLDLKVTKWKRNMITRGMAIGPSLLAALIAGDHGANTAIIISSTVLSFQLPFALIPLLRFTSSPKLMGKWVNSKIFIIVSGSLAALVCLANSYLVIDQIAELHLTDGALAVAIIVTSVALFIYYGFILFLVVRKQRLVSVPPVNPDMDTLYGEHADGVIEDDKALLESSESDSITAGSLTSEVDRAISRHSMTGDDNNDGVGRERGYGNKVESGSNNTQVNYNEMNPFGEGS